MLRIIGGSLFDGGYGLVLRASENPTVSHAFMLYHNDDEDAPFLSTNLARNDVVVFRDFLNELLDE